MTNEPLHYMNLPEDLEEKMHLDLHRYLTAAGKTDTILPECPDLEDWWPQLLAAYLPDGIREYADYPVVSLGWIMFVGMAMARYWDTDWEKYRNDGAAATYVALRDADGFDNMDDHILLQVLHLDASEAQQTSRIAGECAARMHHTLLTAGIEPGTPEAFSAYTSALHQLYLMGIAIELKSLGYHMQAL